MASRSIGKPVSQSAQFAESVIPGNSGINIRSVRGSSIAMMPPTVNLAVRSSSWRMVPTV